MVEAQALITRVRNWIAVNRGSATGSAKMVLEEDATRTLAKEYCEVVEPVAREVERCSELAKNGFFVEACSICDDYPDLLAVAGTVSFQGLAGGSDASVEIAKLLQPFAPDGIVVPIIMQSSVARLEVAYGELDRTDAMIVQVQLLALARAAPTLRIKALRKLYRENPSSRIWKSEIRRMEEGVFEWMRLQMVKVHQEGNFSVAKDLMREFERKDWGVPIPENVLDQCKKLWSEMLVTEAAARYGELERSIIEAGATGDVSRLEELQTAWLQVQVETGELPSKEADLAVTPAMNSLLSVQERRGVDREFDSAVAAVEAAIENGSDDAVMSSLLAHVRSFGREVPEGVIQRANAVSMASRQGSRRRSIRIVLVATIITCIFAMGIGWYVWRLRVQDAVNEFVARVDLHLEKHQLQEAEQLIADHPDIGHESGFLAVSARVTQRRPQWEKDRANFRAWATETEQACHGDVSPAKLASLESTIALLGERFTEAEQIEHKQLLAKARANCESVALKRNELLSPRINEFVNPTTTVSALAKLPAKDQFDLAKLLLRSEQIATVIKTGNALLRECASADQKQSVGTRLEQLKGFQVETESQQTAIKEFNTALQRLTAASRNVQEFRVQYEAIAKSSKSVLLGMGLEADFVLGQGQLNALNLPLSWNSLSESWSDRLHFWKASARPPEELIEVLKGFLKTDMDGVARVLLTIEQRSFDAKGQSAATRVEDRLRKSGVVDLWVVALKKGGPVFRKRIPSKQAVAVEPSASGVLRGRGDLTAEWSTLDAYTEDETKRFVRLGKPADWPTSTRILERLEPLSKEPTFLGARQAMRRLISQVAIGEYCIGSKYEDSLARLWGLLELASIWKHELAFDPTAGFDSALSQWVITTKKKYPDVLEYDWVVPRVDESGIAERIRMATKATEALKDLTVISPTAADDLEVFQKLELMLGKFEPVATIAVNPSDRTRSLVGVAPSDPRELFTIVPRGADGFEWASFRAPEFARFLVERKAPLAPMIVFARAVPTRTD